MRAESTLLRYLQRAAATAAADSGLLGKHSCQPVHNTAVVFALSPFELCDLKTGGQ